MTRSLALVPLVLVLAGCAQVERLSGPEPQTDTASADASAPAPTPAAATTRPPPAGAATPEQFDTTTEAERQEAVAAPEGGERLLGEVVVSLGDVARTGLWLETPLVDAETAGRVALPGGASAKVTLEPAPEGAGSRISLAAMRLLGVPLTDLPTVEVYALP